MYVFGSMVNCIAMKGNWGNWGRRIGVTSVLPSQRWVWRIERALDIATSWVLTLKKCWCRIVINMESSPITAPDMLQTHLRCSTLKIHTGQSEGSNTRGGFWPWCHFLRFQKFGLVAKRPPSPAYVFVGFPKQDSHLRWLKRFLSF